MKIKEIKDHSGLIGSYEYVKYDYDSLIQAYLASAEPREKRIADLEKENAELRKDFIESEEDNNKLRENIYKIDVAKDLINRLLHTLVLSNTPYERYGKIQEEAEQFLNSEVEK